jgi:hypothetical protein
MSEPDMEVAEPENEMMTMMNFSFKKHGFEYRFLRPFEFDDDFNKLDEGQTQTDPTILKEIDLLDQLRDARKRDSKRIPQTIFEFYDNCRKHFAKEFMLLLAGFMSNAEKAKKMDGHIKDDRLFNFFNIKLDGPIKFGKHQIFDDCAADCEAEAKTKLRACGMEIQKLVQLDREKATEAARNKLQACSEDFKTFGEKEWRKQCSNTSLHNILDQHFITFWTNTLQSRAKAPICTLRMKTIALERNAMMQTAVKNLSHCGKHLTGCTTWLFMRAKRMSIRTFATAGPK